MRLDIRSRCGYPGDDDGSGYSFASAWVIGRGAEAAEQIRAMQILHGRVLHLLSEAFDDDADAQPIPWERSGPPVPAWDPVARALRGFGGRRGCGVEISSYIHDFGEWSVHVTKHDLPSGRPAPQEAATAKQRADRLLNRIARDATQVWTSDGSPALRASDYTRKDWRDGGGCPDCYATSKWCTCRDGA